MHSMKNVQESMDMQSMKITKENMIMQSMKTMKSKQEGRRGDAVWTIACTD
jgi:hypothetical protein